MTGTNDWSLPGLVVINFIKLDTRKFQPSQCVYSIHFECGGNYELRSLDMPTHVDGSVAGSAATRRHIAVAQSYTINMFP